MKVSLNSHVLRILRGLVCSWQCVLFHHCFDNSPVLSTPAPFPSAFWYETLNNHTCLTVRCFEVSRVPSKEEQLNNLLHGLHGYFWKKSRLAMEIWYLRTHSHVHLARQCGSISGMILACFLVLDLAEINVCMREEQKFTPQMQIPYNNLKDADYCRFYMDLNNLHLYSLRI